MEENIRKTKEHLSKVSLEDQNKDSRSTCELSEDDQDIFTALITNAKQLTTEGNIKDALDLYKQALKMYYNEKLERKIIKIEAYLQKTEDSSCSARRGSTPLEKSEPDIRASPQKEISDENQEIYNQMISSARQMVNEGQVRDALELNKEALKINYNEKLEKKISKMEMYLKESGDGQGQGRSSVGDTPKQVSSGISAEDKEIFGQLIQSARQYTEQGKIKDALELYREAIKINDNEKLAQRIAKMEQYLKEAGEEQIQEHVDNEAESKEPCSKEESKPEVPSETPKKTVVGQKDQETYNQLIETAKQCTDEGHLKDALDLYREALKIYNSEKLAKKIVRIETYLKENDYSNRENKNQESMKRTDTIKQESQTPIKTEVIKDDQEKFNKLVTQAKKHISEGQVREALKLNKEALEIYHSDKLAKKITKMEQYLKEHGDDNDIEEDENGMVHVGNGYFMYKELYNKLYDHQKEAVLWLWNLHRKRKGGILGDDMGLGKTIQIISFLSGLFDMDKVHAAIIVMPVSLIVNWEKEFLKW